MSKDTIQKQIEEAVERFEEKFVTYPAADVLPQWGGSEENKIVSNQKILIKNRNKEYLTIQALRKFLIKELTAIATKSAEEKHEHNFEVLNPSVHSGGSTYSTIFCTKCGGKKIPHELKEQP